MDKINISHIDTQVTVEHCPIVIGFEFFATNALKSREKDLSIRESVALNFGNHGNHFYTESIPKTPGKFKKCKLFVFFVSLRETIFKRDNPGKTKTRKVN